MGNAIATRGDTPETMVSDKTLNVTSLTAIDPRAYLSGLSDIVALMVFQHQSHMTNLITRIGWEARIAAYEHRLDPAAAPLRDAVVELVDYLLFVDEEPLTAAIKGTSGFAEKFASQGPFDRQGRSLRQLDLEHRLLRHPCSYMIDSAAFRSLPIEVRHAVYRRMWDILSGHDASIKYARLSNSDRRAVVEILRDTLHDLPGDFGSAALGRGPTPATASQGDGGAGRAKTKRELPPCGRRRSGRSSAGIIVDQLAPPTPAGTATYCRPFTA